MNAQLKALNSLVSPYENAPDAEVSYRYEDGEFFVNIILEHGEEAYIVEADGLVVQR